MCKLKSGILFKNSVFVPDDYDSHTQMLEEKGITDTIENMMLGKFVRFEITPPNNDIFSPFSKWKYNVVQDFLPDWYTEDVEKAEERAKEAIQNWVNSHIFINKYGLVIKNGCGYYLKNCTVNEVLYSGTVNKVFGGTVNKVFGGGTVNEVLDGGTVNEVLGGTVQQVLDGGTVQKVLDGGTVKYTQYATQDIKTLIMSQNSFVIDNRTKTIYQSGNWKLKMIENWEE